MSKTLTYRIHREQMRREHGKVTRAMRADAGAAMRAVAAATVEQHRRAMTLAQPLPADEALQAALPHLVAIERLTTGSGQALTALLAVDDADEATPAGLLGDVEEWADQPHKV